jgi:hypothetical protein
MNARGTRVFGFTKGFLRFDFFPYGIKEKTIPTRSGNVLACVWGEYMFLKFAVVLNEFMLNNSSSFSTSFFANILERNVTASVGMDS